jgi:hypothetical protein
MKLEPTAMMAWNIIFIMFTTVKERQIPCSCYCSESGSINGNLLTEILQFSDNLEVHDWFTCLNPCLIPDGHDSQFDIEFLKYIK